jgi:NADPH:quinone reductase-like Zn-dependent oxidoreductase
LAAAVARTPRLSVLELLNANVGVFGLNARRVLRDPKWVERLTGAIQASGTVGLVPHVGKVLAAKEVTAAHRFLETRQATGKVLLEWS